MLHVLPAKQRLVATALCCDGRLLSGQQQWLGIHLSGEEDIGTGSIKLTVDEDPDLWAPAGRDARNDTRSACSRGGDESRAYLCSLDRLGDMPEAANDGAVSCASEPTSRAGQGKWVGFADGVIQLPQVRVTGPGLLVWAILNLASRAGGCGSIGGGAARSGALHRKKAVTAGPSGAGRGEQGQDKADACGKDTVTLRVPLLVAF